MSVHVSGRYLISTEESSSIEGPNASGTLLGRLASMFSYITGMCLWRKQHFVLVDRKTDFLWEFLDLTCLSEAGLRNLQLYQKLRGFWYGWSRVTLRYNKIWGDVYMFFRGWGMLAEGNWCLIHLIHMIILTFYYIKYLDRASTTLWVFLYKLIVFVRSYRFKGILLLWANEKL